MQATRLFLESVSGSNLHNIQSGIISPAGQNVLSALSQGYWLNKCNNSYTGLKGRDRVPVLLLLVCEFMCSLANGDKPRISLVDWRRVVILPNHRV